MGPDRGAGVELEFQPVNDFVLLRPVAPDEASADAAASHAAHAQARWGEVIAVGSGERAACPVSKGDRVAFRPASAIAIALAGEWFAMVPAAELLGVAGRPKAILETGAETGVSEPEAEVWAEPLARNREESLETDVAPDLLDRSEVTGEDLH